MNFPGSANLLPPPVASSHLPKLDADAAASNLPPMEAFNPIEHYRRDAELFDYFEVQHPVDADSAKRIQDGVLNAASLPAKGTVLDVGSGNGWLLERCAGKNLHIVSIDLGKRNLEKLKERHGNGISVVVADAARLPFKPGSFDRIIASEVMEHMNVPESLVKECHGMLREHGSLVVSTPYKEKLRWYLCVHCSRPTPANAHIQSFDEVRHYEQFRYAGFRRFSHELVQSKLFLMLRFSYLLRFLPYQLWRIIDRIFILVDRKAGTIILRAEK